MKILCTCPGKFGDILWALPTVRAISEAYQTPVDFWCAGPYQSLLPLIQQQPYIGQAAAVSDWLVQNTAPMTPRMPPQATSDYDRVFHLGYAGFPDKPLAEAIHQLAYADALMVDHYKLAPLDLDRPWITAPDWYAPRTLVAAFSDEWFELKFGLVRLLEIAGVGPGTVCYGPGTRWDREGYDLESAHDWVHTAGILQSADVVLCCLSSQWVLANALGKTTVVMEPSRERWDNPSGDYRKSIFWRESPRNHMVLGGDGLPTFDARHCADVLREVLK